MGKPREKGNRATSITDFFIPGERQIAPWVARSYLRSKGVAEIRIGLNYGFSDLVLGNGSGVPLTPLREKSGTGLASETQGIAGSRVNVMDPCATFLRELARGGRWRRGGLNGVLKRPGRP